MLVLHVLFHEDMDCHSLACTKTSLKSIKTSRVYLRMINISMLTVITNVCLIGINIKHKHAAWFDMRKKKSQKVIHY